MGPWGSLGACGLGVPVTRVQKGFALCLALKLSAAPSLFTGEESKLGENMVDEAKEEMETKNNAEENATAGFLVPVERYLEAGIHIGTKLKNGDTAEFIYKKRKDGIYILDIHAIDEHMREALQFLKNFDNKDITIVATRAYAQNAAKKLKKFFKDIDIITDRFIPGTFTNPESKHFREPSVVIVCDPRTEKEAIREANYTKIPVVGLVDTDNMTKGIDHVVSMNNKGRKSLALFFWLLARELMLKHGGIKGYDEFKVPISYFERLEIEE